MTNLFGGGGTTVVQQAPPPVTPPVPLPDFNSPAALEARRVAQNQMLASAGRSSTVLTSANNRAGQAQGKTLAASGGPTMAYTGATLGAG